MEQQKDFHQLRGSNKIRSSEFNFATLYFTLLSDLMKKIAESGSQAESTMKARSIIDYFSFVKEYYLALSPVMDAEQIKEFDDSFNELNKYINFFNKSITRPKLVMFGLQETVKELYFITNQKRMLMPTKFGNDSDRNSIGALASKFGV